MVLEQRLNMQIAPSQVAPADVPQTDDWVERLRPRVTKMARFYARLARVDGDDLLQEAWLGLLEGLRELDPAIGTPEQYLLKRARWRLLDALKRARVRRCPSLEDLEAEPAGPLNGADGEASATREFEAGLASTQRAVLACLMLGLTWREAGTRLGCTSANVAYHVRQIRERYVRWDAPRKEN